MLKFVIAVVLFGVAGSSVKSFAVNASQTNGKTPVLVDAATVDRDAKTVLSMSGDPFAAPDSADSQSHDSIVESIVNNHQSVDFSSPISSLEQEDIRKACEKLATRLASVKLPNCLSARFRRSPFKSVNGEPILMTEFPPLDTREPLGRVLVIGGTHGDELTSVSIVFKWIELLQRYHSGLFHWHIAPVINPDGVLLKKATRQNAGGVDINRNLPTPDWDRQSLKHWLKLRQDPRKNPGVKPASEPETKWIIHEIETFKPDVIVSVHAPYGLLDFDSSYLAHAPKKFGRLQLNLLGTYPGSLGNYAGINKSIPVLTLELPNASVMPSTDEVNAIWRDMIRWLRKQLKAKAEQ